MQFWVYEVSDIYEEDEMSKNFIGHWGRHLYDVIYTIE